MTCFAEPAKEIGATVLFMVYPSEDLRFTNFE
jgi:hypothetical protein